MALLFVPYALATTPAYAESNPANSMVRSPQTWYVYVKEGESFSTAFTKVSNVGVASGFWNPTIVVTSPSHDAQSCTITSDDPNGTSCPTSQVASETGVWSVELRSPLATSDPQYRLGRVRLSWVISVIGADGAVAGRVWSDRYWMADQQPTAVALALWYQTEYGYLYRVEHPVMIGIDSDYQSSAFGVVDPATCTSAYSSAGVGSPLKDIASTSCPYTASKIFFALPAADLPGSVTLPDGSTTWLLRNPVVPTLDQVSFTPTSLGSRSGIVKADFSNYEGNATLLVDVDGDGQYDGPRDRSIPFAVTASSGTVAFDGKDNQGIAVPITRAIGFRVVADGYAEVHFTDSDIEYLPQGVRVTRLNGPADGQESRLFWNDQILTTAAGDAQHAIKCSTTDPLTSGDSGQDSSAGVHGWDLGTCIFGGEPNANASPTDQTNGGTWGNNRTIDNWARVDAHLEKQIVLAAAQPDVSVAKSSNPASGSTVTSGQVITYSLTFANSGDAPGSLDYSDSLADVLDDARLSAQPTSDTEGVTALADTDQIRVTGVVPAGKTATVTYQVTVLPDAQRGNGVLRNYLVPAGDAADCDTESTNCTTHSAEPDATTPPSSTPTPTHTVAPTASTVPTAAPTAAAPTAPLANTGADAGFAVALAVFLAGTGTILLGRSRKH